MTGEKRCSKCGETKPVTEFYGCATKKDGYRSECKRCHLGLDDPEARARRLAQQKRSRQAQWARDPASLVTRREGTRKLNAQRRRKDRLEAIEFYGGACACCGERRLGFLTIDHVGENGRAHRDQVGRDLYRWLVKNDFPGGFQTLCWNCNSGKHVCGGVCPHQGGTMGPVTTRAGWCCRKRKTDAMAAYGGKCVCCGEGELVFLTLDHPEGDGGEWRHVTGIKGGDQTYKWLRDRGWPDLVRIMCFNCNCGREISGGECPHLTRSQ